MTPDRWEKVKRWFDELEAMDPAARSDFLNGLALDDPEAVELLERMLRAGTARRAPDAPERPAPERASEVVERFPEFSDYEILSRIDSGGMGTVYRARQRSLGGRLVALKVLHDRKIDRARIEAGANARVRHRGIAAIYEVGEENGEVFYSMELVEGVALESAIASARAPQGEICSLPPFDSRSYAKRVAEVVAEVADAIHAAHQHGLVHRDIKPSNILLGDDGSVKLIDFGLVKDREAKPATQAEIFAGTPEYMSPELLRAHRAAVDHRTDVYSLGVVLYEALTLVRPFEGVNTIDVISRILSPAPPRRVRALNPRAPSDIEIIVQTAMEKEAARRYDTAEKMGDDLRRFLSHQAIVARRPGLVRVVRSALRRRRVALSTITLVVLVGVTAALVTRGLHTRREIAERRAAAAEVLAGAPLKDRSFGDLVRIVDEVASYPVARLGLPPPEIYALRDALDDYKRATMGDAVRAFERSAASGALSEPEQEMARAELLQRLGDLRVLFPDDEAIRSEAVIRMAYPRVSVHASDERGVAIPARVYLAPINVGEGGTVLAPEFAGETPLVQHPVAPGYYRLVIRFESGGTREYAWKAGIASQRATFRASRKDAEDRITEDMVLIPGATFITPGPAALGFGERAVTVSPFYMDRTEVSNAQYREFVTATRHPEPYYWRLGFKPDATQDDLPVVGVSWQDAAAYAAWAGKRLPTVFEWFVATGAAEGREFPWVDGDGHPRGNVHAPAGGGTSPSANWEAYVAHASPVRSFPDAVSSQGVFHLYGNVDEWTETMALHRMPVADPGRHAFRGAEFERIVIGGSWSAAQRGRTMMSMKQFGITADHVGHDLGFRCVKSVE